MYAVHASELRKNLAATLDRVADNAEPVLITRSGGAAEERSIPPSRTLSLDSPYNANTIASSIVVLPAPVAP